jgi:hypothetical protein
MELAEPVTLPGQAQKAKLHPLAALALVVAIPATYALGNPVALARWAFDGAGGTSFRGDALLGLLFLAAGATVVIVIGRRTLGLWRTLALAATTWLSLALSTVVLFAIAFAQAFGDCGGGTQHPVTAPLLIAAGAVYVAVAYWGLRRGWWWLVPLAVVLAFVLCLLLAQALPGVPNSTDPCSD